MRSAFVGGCLLLVAASSGCVTQPHLQGPLPVRNQHPAQLTVFHMAPASATTLPAGAMTGRVDLAYSNLFLQGSGNGNSWRMDGEYLRVGTQLRVGLGGGFDFLAELPVAHTTGGFLDDFIIDYHDALGLPDQSRKTYPRNDYDVTARKGSTVAWTVERRSLELMDIPLQLTWQLAPPGDGRLGAALRGGLELPTGNDHRGFGNGEIDTGLGVLFDYRAAGIGWYAHAQHTFAGTPQQSRRVGLSFADVTSLGLAAELPLSSDLHAFTQVEWETSTLRQLGFREVARDQVLLWLGARLRVVGCWGLELGIGEDLQGLVSPDFTVWVGGTWLPGAGHP